MAYDHAAFGVDNEEDVAAKRVIVRNMSALKAWQNTHTPHSRVQHKRPMCSHDFEFKKQRPRYLKGWHAVDRRGPATAGARHAQ